MFILLRDLIDLAGDNSRLLMIGVSSQLGRTLFIYRLLGLISDEHTREEFALSFYLPRFLPFIAL